MNNYFEKFACQLAQDVITRTGELIIDISNEQIPLLKPALEELQKSTCRYQKSKTSQREKIICQHLAKKIPYSKTEVVTPSGRIDILTPSKIIEVKNVRQYKHAIGQVISYSYYYPNHQRCIHLFGKVSLKQRILIEKECQLANVKVTFQ
jgi:hypothetical protein